MQKREKRRKASVGVRILNILLVVMAVVLVIFLMRMLTELRRAFDRDPYGAIEYSLRDRDYADMVRAYYYRSYDVAPFEGPYEESYQVAAYADAAFRRQYFAAVGDAEREEVMAARMERALAETGELRVAAEDVDSLLATLPPVR